jgi:DNA (cytosine-5)-methyltransferase 1
MPTAVSLFTGLGGSDAGLIDAGFSVLLANDILPYAREVYLANLPETNYVLGDVRQIISFPKADLLVGCYPCQGFSQGGSRVPGRNVNILYREFDRALRAIRPKAFIVENVSGMMRADFSYLLENQVVRFRLAGYRVACQVLDARMYGVPQERSRLFFVGIRSDLGVRYRFPAPTHAIDEGNDRLPVCPTIRQSIGDLPLWPDGGYDTQPFHWYYLSRNRYRGWDERSRTIVANSRHTPLHPLSPLLIRISTDAWHFASDGPARRLSYLETALTAGVLGDGSISQLQVFLFSLLIASMLFFLWLWTGLLSNISQDLLMLMGISSLGAVGAKYTATLKSQLSEDTAKFLYSAGWYSGSKIVTITEKPRLADLLLTNNRLDVYKFQMAMFSILVAIYILRTGATDLGEVKISETLLYLIGISQGVYVGGKAISERENALEDRVKSMIALKAAYANEADPAKKAQIAADYLKTATAARVDFQAVTNIAVDDAKLVLA